MGATDMGGGRCAFSRRIGFAGGLGRRGAAVGWGGSRDIWDWL